MNYVVLDTNIYIHFIDFDQIDWQNIINDKQDFTILIPPVIIDELDGHKYNKNPKISKRVKRILPKIEDLLCEQNALVKIQLISKRPAEYIFRENGLNRLEQDDCILASIIEFKENTTDDKVFYITYDTGPRLKAKTLSIDSLKIEDKYLLPIEPDEAEKKNKELEKELTKFKNLSPKIIFSFLDNEKFLKPKEKNNFKSKEEYISDCVEQIRNEYKYLQKASNVNSQENVIKFLGYLALSDEQIDSYNVDLDKFYKSYEEYFSSIYNRLTFQNDCIEINFKIQNSGTIPGNDIDIDLHFPDGFEILTEDQLPSILKKPTSPYKPKNRFDIKRTGFNLSIFNQTVKTPVIKTDLTSPNIKKTNSYNVTFHLQSLKHNQDFIFETLYLSYADRSKAKNFNIEYKIMIANYPDIVSGKLNVITQ
ncbi:PIN domain-containing protein [Chryseobacterium sp. NFX27]|uniref:PIN domain-containing protein n=1 Tax=Chryseobacterium sp. NFX27 TaxID=2819618 RepID=UPI003CE6FFFB